MENIAVESMGMMMDGNAGRQGVVGLRYGTAIKDGSWVRSVSEGEEFYDLILTRRDEIIYHGDDIVCTRGRLDHLCLGSAIDEENQVLEGKEECEDDEVYHDGEEIDEAHVIGEEEYEVEDEEHCEDDCDEQCEDEGAGADEKCEELVEEMAKGRHGNFGFSESFSMLPRTASRGSANFLQSMAKMADNREDNVELTSTMDAAPPRSSFSFPVLESVWIGSPARMPKAKRRGRCRNLLKFCFGAPPFSDGSYTLPV